MQQRQSRGAALGRPSGTDGSDYSFRMTVDQRYQKVAQRKGQLKRLLASQAACQVLGILWAILGTLKGREISRIATFSLISGFVALLGGEIGRRRSNSKLLKFYIFTSSVATVLSLVHGKFDHLSAVLERDLRQSQDTDPVLVLFDTLETWRVLGGLLVQIIAMLATFSLLKNMSPKRVS
eukprot:Gb_27222 [translate_table: standard]